jgi:hypothetical protein
MIRVLLFCSGHDRGKTSRRARNDARVGHVNSDDNDVRQMTIVECGFFLRGAKRQLGDMVEMTFGNETIFSPVALPPTVLG